MKQTVCAILLLLAASPSFGQLAAPNAAGVAIGHMHLNAADLGAAKKFWVDIIGAAPYSKNGLTGVEAPGIIVLIRETSVKGGMAGSSVNHIGFTVSSLAPYLPRIDAAGYKRTQPGTTVQAIIDGPDGVRVELTEDKSQTIPLKFHHVHFNSPDTKAIQAWYAEKFGATVGKRAQWDAGDVPGANLTYAQLADAVPTTGRALDHIGFEIRGLEAFCKKLTDAGIKLDIPYRAMPQLKLSLAFLTDPWGTKIELTEGLVY